MKLSPEQRQFISLFVMDGEYDLQKSCLPLGVRPSEAYAWFRDPFFQQQLRAAEGVMLLAMGYGPMRVMRDTLAIAHSDISQVDAFVEGGIASAPRHVRVAIKSVKYGVAIGADGKAVPYVKELQMHDKAWALKQAGEWYSVAESPEAKAAQATKAEDGPKRISGLVVRPPLTDEEKEMEDLLS